MKILRKISTLCAMDAVYISDLWFWFFSRLSLAMRLVFGRALWCFGSFTSF